MNRTVTTCNAYNGNKDNNLIFNSTVLGLKTSDILMLKTVRAKVNCQNKMNETY